MARLRASKCWSCVQASVTGAASETGDEGSCLVPVPGIVQQSEREQLATRALGGANWANKTDGNRLVVPLQAFNLLGPAEGGKECGREHPTVQTAPGQVASTVMGKYPVTQCSTPSRRRIVHAFLRQAGGPLHTQPGDFLEHWGDVGNTNNAVEVSSQKDVAIDG